MIDIPSKIDPSLSVTFGLSVMLAIAAVYQDRPVFARSAGETAPSWVPWLIVGALAVASCVFAIFQPEIFAAVGREGFVSP
jgi:hypothetical protein